MADAEKCSRAAAVLAALTARMRDDALSAILNSAELGHGILVIQIPRLSGRPVEASLVQGSLQLRLLEFRDI